MVVILAERRRRGQGVFRRLVAPGPAPRHPAGAVLPSQLPGDGIGMG